MVNVKTMLLYPVRDEIEVILKVFFVFDIVNGLEEENVVGIKDKMSIK